VTLTELGVVVGGQHKIDESKPRFVDRDELVAVDCGAEKAHVPRFHHAGALVEQVLAPPLHDPEHLHVGVAVVPREPIDPRVHADQVKCITGTGSVLVQRQLVTIEVHDLRKSKKTRKLSKRRRKSVAEFC
jgi:hypothetical protein